MKKSALLLAALSLGLFASSRGQAGTFADLRGQISNYKDLQLQEVGPAGPAPETTPFDTLAPDIRGKITDFSATSVGGYVCKDSTVQWIPALLRPIRLAERTTTEKSTTDDPIPVRRELSVEDGGFGIAPVKVTVGANTIMIIGLDPTRFNAVLSVLHAAKLTNRDVTFKVAAVPGCANAFFAADATMN